MAQDHEGRARRAWPLLVAMAKRRAEPLSYGQLCARLGLHHRAAFWFLDHIVEWCRVEQLPPLQALVVNARTRLPGIGARVAGRNAKQNHRRVLERVYGHASWPARPPRA